MQAGEEIVYVHFGELIHGPGEMFMMYGSFVYAIAIYPVLLTVIFLILLNALKSYRGRSLGKELLLRAKDDAEKAGFNQVFLCTDHIGYCEKYGFTYIGDGYHP